MPESPYIGNIIPQKATNELLKQLEKFWENEDISSLQTTHEDICEDIFKNSHSRDADGRYIVKIPFNDNLSQLGKSKMTALRQFFYMERKMLKDNIFAKNYRDFMDEYESLGHMTQFSERDEDGYYTPHHGVMSSGKFRIVFNASAKTSSGISLNETQYVGEKIQKDLALMLINFRRLKYGLTGDIVKMYRQVLVNKEHRKYQKILWRPTQSEPVRVYQLTL